MPKFVSCPTLLTGRPFARCPQRLFNVASRDFDFLRSPRARQRPDRWSWRATIGPFIGSVMLDSIGSACAGNDRFLMVSRDPFWGFGEPAQYSARERRVDGQLQTKGPMGRVVEIPKRFRPETACGARVRARTLLTKMSSSKPKFIKKKGKASIQALQPEIVRIASC